MGETRQDFCWLNGTDGAQQAFHQRAAAARDAVFGRRVFVRGVVEVSNYCRQNCHYCGMRRDNHALVRYRLAADKLADLIIHHRPASITDIDIQAGEDPVAVREVVLPLVRELRRHTDLGITLCLGTLTPREYDELRDAGGDYYVLKIETGDAQHYRLIEAPGTLADRIEAIRYLANTGWKVSSGLIVGLPGQTNALLEQSLQFLTTLPLAGGSVSPFVAGEQTPFSDAANGPIEQTLNCLAWMRLAAPHWLIPAVSAMKLVSANGYVRAFQAGANLATINFTPRTVRADYPIYKRDRVIMDEERVLSAIEQAGCQVSRIGIAKHLRNGASTAPVS
ncbi:MAG TPA: radical SAM protein [Verrucomicrobiae bacterium]|nr:radical SAM protein [Verrucomicrobiae bacterium]